MSSVLLKNLPSVHDLLTDSRLDELIRASGRDAVLNWIRDALHQARHELSQQLAAEFPQDRKDLASWLVKRIQSTAELAQHERLDRVINATGIVLHTGLGRAPLSVAARQALAELSGHCNVEVGFESGERRHRGHQVEAVLRTLTGCEDVLIVNNNAAATLLTLQSLCAGCEVVISRGQLIEIGGSFRLPEIFEFSGAMLREVGTTNRTHLSDYTAAMSPQTAAILHVHPSNFRVIGFSETPSIESLVPLCRDHGAIAIDDIGSGALVDVTQFGLPAEPTFQNSLSAGADVVLGSGDKLLGGPQCGIILGRRDLIERIRKHPLARTVRIDKLTLAALQATLDSYVRGVAETEIPTLTMLSTSVPSLRSRAERTKANLAVVRAIQVEIADDIAAVGGGSLPGVELPTVVLRLRSDTISAEELSRKLRLGAIRVMGRIQHDSVLLDLRSVLPEDDGRLVEAVRGL